MPLSYMYILKCNDGTFYTGSTKDIMRRLSEHRSGEGANYTKKRLPVELVYSESFVSVSEAFKREKQIQNWSHAKKQALISQNEIKLEELSECRNESHAKNNGIV